MIMLPRHGQRIPPLDGLEVASIYSIPADGAAAPLLTRGVAARTIRAASVSKSEVAQYTRIAVDVTALCHAWGCGRRKANWTGDALMLSLVGCGESRCAGGGKSRGCRDHDLENVAPVEVDVGIGKVCSVVTGRLD